MAARLEISSAVPGVEISVTDSGFHEVAHGYGRVSKDVPRGIYQIRLQAGTTVRTSLIVLRDGDVHTDTNVAIEFESAAPIQGTTTSQESHMAAAREASHQLSGLPPNRAGLLLMVRNMRGMDELPLDAPRLVGIERT